MLQNFEQLQKENDNLKKRVVQLEKQLGGTSDDPRQIEVIKKVVLKNSSKLSLSTKLATSENQSVNESGSGTYSVLSEPNGFIEIKINSTIYYLPYYL